jgi:hypothetical protein
MSLFSQELRMNHHIRPLNRSEVAKLLALAGKDTAQGRSIRLFLALSIDRRLANRMTRRAGFRAQTSAVPHGLKK